MHLVPEEFNDLQKQVGSLNGKTYQTLFFFNITSRNLINSHLIAVAHPSGRTSGEIISMYLQAERFLVLLTSI